MRFHSVQVCMLGLPALFGCAYMPDVTVAYYFPKAETSLQIVETVACSKDGGLMTSTTVTPTTSYVSDRDIEVGRLAYQTLSGSFSDADVTVNLTEDGRLTGINTSSTGQGGAVIKDVVALAGVLAVMRRAGPGTPSARHVRDACTFISSFGGEKPLTLLYRKTISYDDPADPKKNLLVQPPSPVEPLPGSEWIDAQVLTNIPEMVLKVEVKPVARAPLLAASGAAESLPHSVPLELNRVQWVLVDLTGPDATFSGRKSIWQAEVAVPLKEQHYHLPIPVAVAFGSQAFEIALSPAGAVQKLRYSKTSGAPSAVGAVSDIAGALKGQSIDDKVAAVRAQADLIAQQQRLLQCQTKPGECE